MPLTESLAEESLVKAISDTTKALNDLISKAVSQNLVVKAEVRDISTLTAYDHPLIEVRILKELSA